jgi:phage terminase small subunit
MSKDKLTAKQEKACQEYIKTGNKSEAYRRAYGCEKWKSESINRKAHEFFEKVKIVSRVEELQAPALEEAKVTNERLIEELAKIAFFDVRKLYGKDGNLLKPHELEEEIATAIKSFKAKQHGKDGEITTDLEYTINDKMKAIELLMRARQMFNDQSTHNHNFGGLETIDDDTLTSMLAEVGHEH